MKHTLIPLKERNLIHHEYHMRTLIVFLNVFTVAAVAGIVTILPAYLSSWLADRAAISELALIRSDKDQNSLAQVEKDLLADKAILNTLSSDSGAPRFSDIVRKVSASRASVNLASFSMSRAAASSIVTSLVGWAPTRSDLLAFKARLEGFSPQAVVDLPINELAKSTNVTFSLKLTEHLP